MKIESDDNQAKSRTEIEGMEENVRPRTSDSAKVVLRTKSTTSVKGMKR